MIPPSATYGTFISFSYNPPQGLASQDPSKEAMVLNPNWQGKMHAIDLKRVTPAERMVLTMIMDPETKNRLETVPYPLVRDVIKRMDPIQVVKNPLQFYQRFVKPFIRNKDVYRRYDHRWIANVKVLKKGQLTTPVSTTFTPAPGFTPLFKPGPKGSPFKK